MTSDTAAIAVFENPVRKGWRASFIRPMGAAALIGSKPPSSLVIGIDFGTTYTGVTYAISDSLGSEQVRVNSTTRDELETVVSKLTVIKSWPNSSHQYAEKTPTLLAYAGGTPIAWGGQVSPTHDIRIAGFKLGLHAGSRSHYLNSAAASRLGGFLNNPNWRHPDLPSKTAVDYAADYLSLVGHHVVNTVFTERFGDPFLRNHQICFVLTVPAIWSDQAKDATRRAAERAGIPHDNLTMITEPEAAAHYCATTCEEVDLEVEDNFMVCDAGGGTVVMSLLR